MFIGPSEEVIGQITGAGVELVPPRPSSRLAIDRRREEKKLQASIVELAKTLRYRVYHTYDSRRSAPGFPDLILVRDRRLVAVECKSSTGKLTKPQVEWLRAFDAVKRVDAIVVRPGPTLDLVAYFLGEDQ